jgi:diguanylate cyclase (GGDEF)-like protein
VLVAQSRAPRRYSPGDVHFLQSLANVLADALARSATEDEIRHRALHDSLTGLPNRVLFHDRLEQALARVRRRSSRAAILFLDLDRFKLVNDSLGHQVGDELLAAVAPRLRHAVRATDTVARFGGDEFAVLLEDISGERDAIEMAQRIAAVFAQPFVLADSEHFVTTSVGIALAEGDELADGLIRDADAAMYRAKERGRARYELFDKVMRERASAHLRVERELRRALERDELALVYQPVVSLQDRSIAGVEALLRWQHPQRGLIAPSEFIAIAEEAGLIEPIGRWALDTACRQRARWERAEPGTPPVWIAVNLSAVLVARPGLPEAVAEVLHDARLDPRCLTVEISECLLLRDNTALTDALPALKQLGVRLALDDFGTGYSSLGELTRLPLDMLKIERSFIDGLGTKQRDSAITEAIIAMAHALSLTVVADGVEHRQQLDELVRLGCDLAQGSALGPPVSAQTLARLLARAPIAGPKSAHRTPVACDQRQDDAHGYAELPGCSGETVTPRHS